MTNPEGQRVAAVAVSVDALRHAVEVLSEQFDDLQTATEVDRELLAAERKTASRWRWVTASIGVVLVVLGIVAWVAVSTALEQRRLNEKAFCPFYGLILGSYNPESRAEGNDRNKYNEQFDVMREVYAELHCTNALIPPPRR